MALTTTEEVPPVPAQSIQTVRRTDRTVIESQPGDDPEIRATRRKRRNGAVQTEKDIIRFLSEVMNEQFGNTTLTVGQAAQAMADTFDRWALEDHEP